MPELKPCPFCGGTPYINTNWHGATSTSIKCKDCGCTTQIENGIDAAIEVWNSRNNDHERISLMQYENLRKHFNKLVDNVLGKDYYNMGMDVYTCDEITCEDLSKKLKKKWYHF
mgnify:CR=1 FL=1|jgi:restriction alleviation protein, Lar family